MKCAIESPMEKILSCNKIVFCANKIFVAWKMFSDFYRHFSSILCVASVVFQNDGWNMELKDFKNGLFKSPSLYHDTDMWKIQTLNYILMWKSIVLSLNYVDDIMMLWWIGGIINWCMIFKDVSAVEWKFKAWLLNLYF